MSVTASRLGSAPITIDWSNLIRVPVPGQRAGLSQSPDPHLIEETWRRLKARFSASDVGFFDAPTNEELSQAKESEELAKSILAKGNFTDCLFLGIGGSSLGPLSLLTSLQDREPSKIQFHFMENPDPLDWAGTIRKLDPETTLVCAVTKSGTTFETMAQLLLALEWLGSARIKTHVIAITDPVKGDLKAFANQEGIPTLHIAPSMGGRFSVFTPVGLFPLALSGLSITNFLQGARQVRDYMEKTPLEKNPIFILGSEMLRHAPQRTVHVCMPYSNRLKLLGSWFVQLWGESLGKDGKGFTPLAAVGATDQHSILQLLRDGPDDKITLFLTVDRVADEVKLPSASLAGRTGKFPAFRILQGHSLGALLSFEYRATSLVLTKRNRPNATIQLDQLDERTMGALYFMFATLTAFTGTLMNINPFDQPGVEEGKVYIRESLIEAERARAAADDDGNSAVSRLRRD